MGLGCYFAIKWRPKKLILGFDCNWIYSLYNIIQRVEKNCWFHPKETLNAMELNQVCEILSRNSREWLWRCMNSCMGRLDAPSKHLLTISDRSWYADMSCQGLSRWFSIATVLVWRHHPHIQKRRTSNTRMTAPFYLYSYISNVGGKHHHEDRTIHGAHCEANWTFLAPSFGTFCNHDPLSRLLRLLCRDNNSLKYCHFDLISVQLVNFEP